MSFMKLKAVNRVINLAILLISISCYIKFLSMYLNKENCSEQNKILETAFTLLKYSRHRLPIQIFQRF